MNSLIGHLKVSIFRKNGERKIHIIMFGPVIYLIFHRLKLEKVHMGDC